MNQSLALLLFGLDTLKWHLEDFSFNWPVQGLSRAANNGSCFPHHVPDIDFNQLGPAGASNHTDSSRWAPHCVFLAIFYKLRVAKPGCSTITAQIKHSCHCATEIWSRQPRLTQQCCRKRFFSLFYAETQRNKALRVSVCFCWTLSMVLLKLSWCLYVKYDCYVLVCLARLLFLRRPDRAN